MQALGRAGWAARALLYFVVAVLVSRVASAGDGRGPNGAGSAGGDEASQTGALREIADRPFGKALLALVAVGFVAFAIWRFILAWRDDDDDGAFHRVAYVVSGIIYAGLGVLAASMVLGDGGGGGGGGGGGNEEAQGLTARVLSWPFGPWLVGAVALGILAVAGYFFWRGVTHDFMDDLDLAGVSRRRRSAIRAAGVAGQCGRAAVFAVVAWFVGKAALEFDANEARGLDGALREVAEAPWGPPLLWGVAAGLGAYAAFCVVRARYDETTT